MKNKELHKSTERLQADLWNKFDSDKARAYEVALEGDSLLKLQFMNDFDIIINKFNEWSNKSKSEDQKTVLVQMTKALFRINLYGQNQHSLAKTAIAESIIAKKQMTIALKELDEHQKELEQLKSQIEFHERTE